MTHGHPGTVVLGSVALVESTPSVEGVMFRGESWPVPGGAPHNLKRDVDWVGGSSLGDQQPRSSVPSLVNRHKYRYSSVSAPLLSRGARSLGGHCSLPVPLG